MAIYKLALSTDSKKHDNKSINFTVAQHKSRRNPHSGNRLNIYKVNDTVKNRLALILICAQIKVELLLNITNKVV